LFLERKELEKKLEFILGVKNLENVSKLNGDESEVREIELEMELCNQRSRIYQMKIKSQHLNEDIDKSKRSIQLLKE
jgi:hypothetical protein